MVWYEPVVWVITILVVLVVAYVVGQDDDFRPYG